MAINKELLKDFNGFIKSKKIAPDVLNNDQDLWGAIRGYEEAEQITLGKSDVQNLKDYFYNKNYEQGASELFKVENKQGGEPMKGKKKIVEKKVKLNEAALTDFYMNAQVEVEGLGSGKIILITPDSVSVRFADDSEKTFLQDEFFKVEIQAEEGEAEGEGEAEADAPVMAPADPAGSDDLPLESKEIQKSIKKLTEAVALINKKLTEDDAQEGEPVQDPQNTLDPVADKDAGSDTPVTKDPDKEDSIPAPIAQEVKALKDSLKKVIEAVAALDKQGTASTASLKKVIEAVSKIVEADDAQEGEPVKDPQDAIDLKPNVPAGNTVPAASDKNKETAIPKPITKESRRKKALVKALTEQKALAGII